MSQRWPVARLSELCTKISDGTHHSPKVQFDEPRPGLFKYITSKNLRPWGLDLSEVTYIGADVHREIYARCNPEVGDVLLTKDGANTGMVAINTLTEQFSLLSSVALLKPDRTQLVPRFLRYFLESPDGANRIAGEMTGTAIRRIVLRQIKEAQIPVAPIDEQERIVSEIEKQFTRLEAAVALLRRIQTNISRYRAAVVMYAFDGRLIASENDCDIRETGADLLTGLACRRTRLSDLAQKGPSTNIDLDDLPSLPKDWSWTSLEQLSWSSAYGTSEKCSYDNSGAPVLRIPNIAKGLIDYTDLKFAARRKGLSRDHALAPGDLLVVRTNGSRGLIGRGAVVRTPPEKATGYASYLIRFRLAGPPTLFAWLSTIWNAPFLRAWFEEHAATSAGQYNLSMTTLNKLPLPLPPLVEQQRIVVEAERRLSVVDKLENVVEANLLRAKNLRQSILRRAFSENL